MGPKKKEGKGLEEGSVDWRAELDGLQINSTNWECFVGCVVEASVLHSPGLNLFAEEASAAKRKAIRSISAASLTRNITYFGDGKSDKLGSCYSLALRYYPTACNEAAPHLKKNSFDAIPLELLARIIKYEILKLKEENLITEQMEQMKEQELENEMNYILSEHPCSADGVGEGKSGKGKKSDKSNKSEKGKKDGKDKSGKKGGNKDQKKPTKLTKIGEEWRDAVYISDAPKGGPNLYVVISGIYHADLIVELINVGIPVKCIARLKRDGDEIIIPPDFSLSQQELFDKKKKSVVKRSAMETEPEHSPKKGVGTGETATKYLKQIHLNKFWKKLNEITLDFPRYKLLEETAFINYSPNFESHSETEMMTKDAFDTISYLMYDLTNLERFHILYMRHMKIVDVEEKEPPVQLNELKLYADLLDSIPSECVTIPVLLDCLLKEVCCRFDAINIFNEKYGSKEPKPVTLVTGDTEKLPEKERKVSVDDKHPEVNHVSKVKKDRASCGYRRKFKKVFELIEAKYKKRSFVHEETPFKSPFIMSYGDDISLKSFHLQPPKVDLLSATLRVLEQTVLATLWRQIPELSPTQSMLCGRELNKLFKMPALKHFSNNLLVNCIHGLMFEYLKCQTPIGVALNLPFKSTSWRICEESDSIPKDFFYRTKSPHSSGSRPHMEKKFVHSHRSCDMFNPDIELKHSFANLCPDLCFLATKRPSIERNKACLDDYTAVEELPSLAMLQTLYDASLTYNCIDFHYFQPTDVILLHCHNAPASGSLASDAWAAKLPTPVCFRDFVNFILDEENDWFEDDDKYYKEECEREDLEEEKIKELNKKRDVFLKEAGLTGILEHCKKFNAEQFIKPGSIKDDIIQEQLKAELAAKEKDGKDKKNPKDSKKKDSKSDKGSKGSKGGKGGKSGKEKSAPIQLTVPPRFKENSVYRKLPMEHVKEGEPYVFRGYDLGNTRLQISGTTTNLYSNDATYIKVEKSEWMWGQKNLLLEISKLNHHLTIHSLAELPPKPADELFNIHIHTANGINIALELLEDAPKSSFTKVTSIIKRSASSPGKLNNLVEVDENVEVTRVKTRSIIENGHKNIDKSEPIQLTKTKTSLQNSGSLKLKPEGKIIRQIEDNIEPRKFDLRVEMERKLHNYLAKIDTMTPEKIRESQLLRSKEKMLEILKQAKENYVPCFKVCSSKLHSHKYIKRIKPHISISIEGVIKKITYKQGPGNHFRHHRKSCRYYSKWTRPTTTSDLKRVPMHFKCQASWPNGLLIKTIQGVDEHDPFYIKQEYITKGPACKDIKDELYRCVLRNGTVLIFKTEGMLEILCPDSSMYLCRIDGFEAVNLKPVKRKKKKSKQRYEDDMVSMIYKKDFRKIIKNPKSHLIEAHTSLNSMISRRFYRKQLKECSIIAKSQFKITPNLIPIPEYSVLMPDGTKCTVRNNRVCNYPKKLLVQSATDHRIGETYTERQDGTKSILGPNGVNIVAFPDGTRIKTYFKVATELVFIDLSQDSQEILEEKDYEKRNVGKKSTESVSKRKSQSEKSVMDDNFKDTGVIYQQDTISDLNDFLSTMTSDSRQPEEAGDEGFVLVHLSCEIEHPNYATIIYSSYNEVCKIGVPDHGVIEINNKGNYYMRLDKKTDVILTRNCIQFETLFDKESNKMSTSFIDISPFTERHHHFEELPTYLINVDSDNNITELTYDGILKSTEGCETSRDEIRISEKAYDTIYRKVAKLKEKDIDSREDNYEKIRTAESFAHDSDTSHEKRYFVFNRDFTGFEFIHKSVREKYLRTIKYNDGTISINERDDDAMQIYMNGCTNVYETYSNSWLVPYVTGKIAPKYIARKQVKPSTYFPGFWLSVFSESADNVSASESNVLHRPTLSAPLAIIKRVMMDIFIGDPSPIKQLNNALKNYTDITNDINDKLSCECIIQPKKQSSSNKSLNSESADQIRSAHTFKEQWYQRERETQYYKNILKTAIYPSFFSVDMEEILFDQVISMYSMGIESRSKRSSKASIKTAVTYKDFEKIKDLDTDPLIVTPNVLPCQCCCHKCCEKGVCQCSCTEEEEFVSNMTQISNVRKRESYVPNLKLIAKEWIKRGYDRQVPGKKSEEVAVQTEEPPKDDEKQDDKSEANEFLEEMSNVQVSLDLHMESLIYNFEPEYTFLKNKIPIKGLGVRPYVKPMALPIVGEGKIMQNIIESGQIPIRNSTLNEKSEIVEECFETDYSKKKDVSNYSYCDLSDDDCLRPTLEDDIIF